MLKNRIQHIITAKKNEGFKFSPSNSYYQKIGIGKKTFGAFLRNEQQPNLIQIDAIATSLGVKPLELIDAD